MMESASKKQRRQRAVLSCNDCRRRKLKCDRLSPCDRCIKGGIASSCAYGPDAHIHVADEPYEHVAKKQRRLSTQPIDSVFPEERASKSGHCEVVDGEDDTRPGNLAAKRLEQLERDVAHLEQPISKQEEPRDQAEFLARSPNLKSVSHLTTAMGMMKGRSYGTVFYGTSSPMSVVAHVSSTHILTVLGTNLMILVSRSSLFHENSI
jgi:hypothetical protein